MSLNFFSWVSAMWCHSVLLDPAHFQVCPWARRVFLDVDFVSDWMLPVYFQPTCSFPLMLRNSPIKPIVPLKCCTSTRRASCFTSTRFPDLFVPRVGISNVITGRFSAAKWTERQDEIVATLWNGLIWDYVGCRYLSFCLGPAVIQGELKLTSHLNGRQSPIPCSTCKHRFIIRGLTTQQCMKRSWDDPAVKRHHRCFSFKHQYFVSPTILKTGYDLVSPLINAAHWCPFIRRQFVWVGINMVLSQKHENVAESSHIEFSYMRTDWQSAWWQFRTNGSRTIFLGPLYRSRASYQEYFNLLCR